MKAIILLLLFVNILNSLACKNHTICNDKGSFCSWYNLNDCCCPNECLLIGNSLAGFCFGTAKSLSNSQLNILGNINITVTNQKGNVIYSALDFINENYETVPYNIAKKPVFYETVNIKGDYDLTLRSTINNVSIFNHFKNSFNYTIDN